MSADTTTNQHTTPESRPKPGETLRNANLEELVISALAGGDQPTIIGALLGLAKDIEPLYEYFGGREEQWVATSLHLIQHRLRVLAEVLRRREVRDLTRAS